MKISRFRAYIFIQGLVVLGVIATFHFISNRNIAALIASSLFVVSSSGVVIFESFIQTKPKSHTVIGSTSLFLTIFVLPIIILRLSHWGDDFSSIELFGIKANELHRFSNYGFMAMLIGYFVETMRENKKGP